MLVGRNSLDGETGQVGPELAELLGLPFADGVKELEDRGGWLRLELELDDGMQEVEVQLPAVLSVAERLCEPCKVAPEGRAAVPAERITRVGTPRARTRALGRARKPDRGGADPPDGAQPHPAGPRRPGGRAGGGGRARPGRAGGAHRLGATRPASSEPPPAERAAGDRVMAVLLEPGRPQVGVELVGAAARLAARVGGTVEVLAPGAGGGDRPRPGPTSSVHWSAPRCRATWPRP